MPCEVVVRYFAPIRDRTGRDEEAIAMGDECQLKDLVRLVGERYRIGESLVANCLIVVNGKGSSQLAGLETKLRPGDRISFLPPISGG